jgi:hypothetical protein
MAAPATRRKRKPRLFHATLQVTRTEEWCVEAATAEEARQLLADGAGHRCCVGECVHLEVERISET